MKPFDELASALRAIEVRTRAEVAELLGISRQAVEQAEKSGLQKLAARRGAFDGYL
jgi:DNA-directed RNA polymerase specialized sigma subunit